MRRLILLLLTPACAWCQSPGPFVLTDLGALPNFSACIATAISQNGKVAGYCHPAGVALQSGPSTRAFLYSGGTLIALPDAMGTTIVNGVNDAGSVVGLSLPSGSTIVNDILGSLIAPYTYQSLGAPPPNFWPLAENNSIIAGLLASSAPSILNINGLTKSSYFSFGSAYSLPALGSSANTFALAISPKGTMAGAALSMNLMLGITLQPVLWTNYNTLTPLAPPANLGGAVGLAVNDQGLAGGAGLSVAVTPNLKNPLASYTLTDLHALLWNNGAVTDLTPALGSRYGVVLGVNDAGWAVGFRADALPNGGLGVLDRDDPGFRGFVYTGGKAHDLNALVTGAGGWNITSATAVNNAGQIVGGGYLNGVEHAILLTPAGSGPIIGSVEGGGLSVPAVQAISANGYFTVFGANFARAGTSSQLAGSDIVNGSLPTNLGSTCVNVGASRAFLSYVSPAQINAIAPAVPSAGPAAVSVVTNCGTPSEITSAAVNVPLAGASPEFIYWVQNADGRNPVIAVDAVRGDYIGPPGLIAGLTFRAARAGDVLTIYGIGLGRTGSGPAPGMIPAAADSVPPGYSVTIEGTAVAATYAGVTPGSAGLYQVNVAIPAGIAPGNRAIVLNANGGTTPGGAFLAIGP